MPNPTQQPSALFHFNDLAPVVRELPTDLETPVSVYLKLAGQGPSFLLESITGGEALARYSFIGINPSQSFILRGRSLEIKATGQSIFKDLQDTNPLDALRQELEPYRCAPLPGLPRFNGGLVGTLSYEMMRFIEPNVDLTPHPDLPDAIFLLADTLVAFDRSMFFS